MSTCVVGAAKSYGPTSTKLQARCAYPVPIPTHPHCRTQAHVGEYGVHWNFFHTIALVALAAAVVSPAPGRRLHLALGLTAAHQAVLSLGEKYPGPHACSTASVQSQSVTYSLPTPYTVTPYPVTGAWPQNRTGSPRTLRSPLRAHSERLQQGALQVWPGFGHSLQFHL